jgi:hypothetical protein
MRAPHQFDCAGADHTDAPAKSSISASADFADAKKRSFDNAAEIGLS